MSDIKLFSPIRNRRPDLFLLRLAKRIFSDVLVRICKDRHFIKVEMAATPTTMDILRHIRTDTASISQLLRHWESRFVPSIMPGFNDRAVRRTCADNPALARRTSAGASEGSMFAAFLNNLAIPYANTSNLKMIHITTLNEWHEDTEIEPSVATAPTTVDDSPSGTQYTQGLVYQGFGTTYLDILRDGIAVAKP